MGLQLTNHRFNFDKFRVCIRLTCQTFGGSYQDYLDRSGLLDEGRLTRGFRWIHQASKPWLDSQLQGSFQTLCCLHKEPPSNFVSCAPWVPMFEFVLCATLSLAPHNFLCGLTPIKRCSYGVITTKPPSDIPFVVSNRSRGVAMVQIWPSPLVIFFISVRLQRPV